jgi:nicotinamidase-related amidase
MLRENFPEVWESYFADVEQRVVPNAKLLLEAFRRHGLRVIHITLAPELADAADMTPLRRPAPTG